jgi:hypothetical protein
MHVHVRRWLTAPYCDIQRQKTTITITDTDVTVAITVDGRLSRKKAIGAAWDSLNRETGRWSPSFLHALKMLA